MAPLAPTRRRYDRGGTFRSAASCVDPNLVRAGCGSRLLDRRTPGLRTVEQSQQSGSPEHFDLDYPGNHDHHHPGELDDVILHDDHSGVDNDDST